MLYLPGATGIPTGNQCVVILFFLVCFCCFFCCVLFVVMFFFVGFCWFFRGFACFLLYFLLFLFFNQPKETSHNHLPASFCALSMGVAGHGFFQSA